MILGVVAILVAAVAGWALADKSDRSEAEGSAPGIVTSAPATSGAAAGAPTATSAGVATHEDNRPVRPPMTGGAAGTSAAPGAGATTPGSPSATPGENPGTEPTGTAEPVAEGKRLTSPGGAVYAVCSGVKATLTSWEPASGYSAKDVVAGPAVTTSIVFAKGLSRYRMTVTCVAGTPTPVVLPL